MNALVINLKRSEDRMSFMSQQLESLNISFERIEAVDANELNPYIYEKHAHDWNRVLRYSEVACFLSHKKAWEYVIEKGEQFMIFEDDVILSKDIVDAVRHIEKKQKYNFINLETGSRKKLIHKKSFIFDG
jgi:glycosyl transferase family 25